MSDNHFDESKVRANMLVHSQQKILLLDHTKFDASANLLFGNLKSVDVVITDEYLPNQWTEFCRENQIYLDYALDTGGEIPT